MKFDKESFKSLRKSLGLNQAEFGELLGLTQQAVSDIERGINKPSKTLMRLLEYRYSDNFSLEEGKSGPGSTKGTEAGVSHGLSLDADEIALVKALREIDPISRIGVYSTALIQLKEAQREEEIRRDKRKKAIIEDSINELKKAIAEGF